MTPVVCTSGVRDSLEVISTEYAGDDVQVRVRLDDLTARSAQGTRGACIFLTPADSKRLRKALKRAERVSKGEGA